MTRQEIIDEFHRIYYGEEHRSPIINNTRWKGTVVQKCPLDLFSYFEIMCELKTNIVIETGTLYGGSAKWFDDMLDLIWGPKHRMCDYDVSPLIISIDIKDIVGRKIKYNYAEFIKGSSVSQDVINRIIKIIRIYNENPPSTLVILDSDHRAEHVYKELDIYSQFVTPGSFLIVEDTDCNGHPILPRHGPGPWEAVHDWLPKHPEFEIDKSREKFLMTCNPDGYLRRKA